LLSNADVEAIAADALAQLPEENVQRYEEARRLVAALPK